ncbi:CxxC motif-containing protein (DUF1111 family) [Rhodoligotrophos appendicifer]|uniref:di-heme oxidoreductase family protein n=1 Tax=Rhodoligotrophos appendicifer TaxID=987056 RepID=UPI001FE859CE|nr:di-heme oxidoredictase family protein [Rhodoligotrophos appendicifer]
MLLLGLSSLLAGGLAATLTALAAGAAAPALSVPPVAAEETLGGGAATSHAPADRNAFSHSSANLPFAREFDFKIGNGVFRKQWVSAPSSTKASDGLGPLFNARACQNCHLKDGRGHPPALNSPEDRSVSMLLRLAVPAKSTGDQERLSAALANVIPDPIYGAQLQDFAVQGHRPEARINVTYDETEVILADGETVSLRKPVIQITDLTYGPLSPDIMTSPRIANPMIGLGLLEAISEADILSNERNADRSSGISGQANRVWSAANGRVMLGRFGWKAGQPTIADQAAAAFAGDMGISSKVVPLPSGDCTERQRACLDAPNGNTQRLGGNEASDAMFDLVVFYSKHLAVPVRRQADRLEVIAGRALFYQAGCAACHRPSYITDTGPGIQPELAGQKIWPYTDLLLHDMGTGLSDGFTEGRATGAQWRTAPLWGIGLTEAVSGHTTFLHDGRASNLLEAILWHGGEAEAAKQRVVDMSRAERQELLAFLNSL